ncbi:MAG: YjbQ family protein [Thermoprotei archaeon]|nr:MAG: YjbQ family protein [Thermoprotei archaeon]RLE90165.1 MAG: YjbQ family protein [Thermoprotei archaeon]
MEFKVFFKELHLRTERRIQLLDITDKVERIVEESGIENGICLVFAPHATAAIIANEHERGLMEDIVEKLKEDYPRNGRWKHNMIDDNASAHLASAFIGASRTFPVRGGRLIRGTWQHIMLVELDGPRYRRSVLIEVIGTAT